jgi:hypothetical protein
VKLVLTAMLVGGYLLSLHHLQGIYPLPNKLANGLVVPWISSNSTAKAQSGKFLR